MRLLRQRIFRVARLRTQVWKESGTAAHDKDGEGMRLTNTAAAFLPQPAEALITVFAARAVLQLALAALRQHAFRDDARAQHLVAREGELGHEEEGDRCEKDHRKNFSLAHRCRSDVLRIPGRTRKIQR